MKALAEQTAKATGEIGQQIAGIQAATQESVNAIKEISGTIEKTVGDLLDHRRGGGRAGRCDPGNLPQRAAGRAGHPAGLFQHHRRAARRQRDRLGLPQVLSAAQSLSGDSNRLKLEVGKFLDSVRAA